jgi:hypothetical protein
LGTNQCNYTHYDLPIRKAARSARRIQSVIFPGLRGEKHEEEYERETQRQSASG